MKNTLWENLVKNIVLVALLIPAYFGIHDFVYKSILLSDKVLAGSFLVAVSILSVVACFGNFAFTYEKVQFKDRHARLLAHMTTGLFVLLIGLSLEMTAVLVGSLIGNFFIFNLSLLALYIASILYDFWDLKRSEI